MTMMNVRATTFGERLQTSQLLAGIEQEDMATRLGVSRTTVSKWERGITEPTVSSFVRWAQETNQPVEAILDGLEWCTPRDLNPEPTDSEFWAIVERIELFA